MIFGTSVGVNQAAPLIIQIKGTSINKTSSYKYLGTHLDSTLALNGKFNSKAQFQITIAVKTSLKSECKSRKNDLHEYCHFSVYIQWNCKSKSIGERHQENLIEFMNEVLVSSPKPIQTNTMKLTLIMTYVKCHACQIVRASITRQLPAPMTNCFELLSHSKSIRNNKLSIALPRARTRAAQNGFIIKT